MHPNPLEVKEIYQLWKQEFAFDDGGSIDDYFQHNFNVEHCYVLRVDHVLASMLCAHPHRMKIGNEIIPVVFISGVITKAEFRHLGLMKQLFQQVYTQLQDRCALYILQAYHPEIYEPLGFTMKYVNYEYEVSGENHCPTNAISIQSASDLCSVSDDFLANYDAYLTRDLSYYENYIRQVHAQNASLFGIYEDEILQGFALAYPDKHTLRIEEMMVRNEDVRRQLIAFAQQNYKHVHLVSCTPLKQYPFVKKQGNLMLRIANLELLKNSLHQDVSSLEDVFEHLEKPLYHYDFW